MLEVEGPRSAAQEAPSQPRWAGARNLVPVQKFNEHCIELLSQVAGRDDVHSPAIRQNVALWLAMDTSAVRRISRTPFVLLDIGFQDNVWWSEVAHRQGREPGPSVASGRLPSDLSGDLMYETLMFCWQMVGANRTVAQTSFGMSPSVVDLISELTPQDVRGIAGRQSSAVQIRWDTNIRFWQELLQAALSADDARLAALQLHAKLLLVGGLVHALD